MITPLKNHKIITSLLLVIFLNLLSFYILSLKQQPISIDGILYLNTAKAFMTQGYKAAYSLYPWPFYSILIAYWSMLFHLSLATSAICLNMLFSSILCVYFLLLVFHFQKSNHFSLFFWSIIVIVFCPFLNHEKIYFLRDMGYYAFLLASLYYLCTYLENPTVLRSFYWQISLLLASLFRVEGFIILAAAPIVLWLYTKIAFKKIAALYSISLLALLILTGLLTFYYSHHTIQFNTKAYTLLSYFNYSDYLAFFKSKLLLQQQLLSPTGQDNAVTFMLSGLFGVFFQTLIQSLGIVSVGLLIYLFYLKFAQELPQFNHPISPAIKTYVIIITMTLMLFLLRQFFLTERYIFPLSLIFLLFLAVGLNYLWLKNKLILKILLLLFILINMVSSFGQFGPSKTYIIQAGQWIAAHTDQHALLNTNEPLIAYYANREISPHQQHADYLALLMKHDNNDNTLKSAGFNPRTLVLLQTFTNNKQDKISIYAVQKRLSDVKP